MLQLKNLLIDFDIRQSDLARAVELSPAAIAQLINHQMWPKSLNQQQLAGQITDFLIERGVPLHRVRDAFEEVKPPRGNAGTSATPETLQGNQECNDMLMGKQVLLPAAKQAFGLRRNPFGDIESVDEIFIHQETRYIRESLYQAARYDGFLAVIGESGGGKSTLRRELIQRLDKENAPVILIEPYVLGMEDKESKGKTLKSTHIAESVMSAVAPLEGLKSSPQARFEQMHKTLKASHAAGFKHALLIEEAHAIPTPTLRHLKRMRDQLEIGFTKLINIILIGQPELATKLSPKNGELREVSQRIEIATLSPVPVAAVQEHLAFRLACTGKKLAEVVDDSGVQAVIDRLCNSGKDGASQLYPLAISNLMVAAMNLAADLGEPLVTADIVKGV